MKVCRERWRIGVLSMALLALIATIAAVASSASAAAGPKKGLRLAFFSVGGNNTYLLAGMKGARDAAKKYGASIQVFDGQFNGALQLNQIMGAIAQKSFDGMVI